MDSRSFIGSPSLVILERPLQFLSTDWVHRFAEIIEEIRSKGVAVLWFAGDQEIATTAFSKPVVHLSLKDSALWNADGGSENE